MSVVVAKFRYFAAKVRDLFGHQHEDVCVVGGVEDCSGGEVTRLVQSKAELRERLREVLATRDLIDATLRDVELSAEESSLRFGDRSDVSNQRGPLGERALEPWQEVRVVVEVHGRSVRTRVALQNP